MPDSRKSRVWFPMLLALVALLAFVPQAGATEYEDELDEPVACSAFEEYEDTCSEEEPPVGCVSGDYEGADPCSDDVESEKPGSDGAKSCEDGPVARSA